jgi:hypothetical protein
MKRLSQNKPTPPAHPFRLFPQCQRTKPRQKNNFYETTNPITLPTDKLAAILNKSQTHLINSFNIFSKR